MSIEDESKVIEWLEKHWKSPRACPICHNNNWSVSDKLWELREFRGSHLVVGGPVVPLVAVTCQVCAHTVFFNAIAVGVVRAGERGEKNSE